MKRTHVHLTTQQMAQLQALSGHCGLSMAELVRRAVDDFLKQLPVAVRQAADTGSTGVTISNDGAKTQ